MWLVMTAGFVFALYGSARMGIRLAEKRVPPESVAPKAMFKAGEDMEAEGSFVFASTQAKLREYYFREETMVGSGMGASKGTDVFEHSGMVVLHIVESDADLVHVEFVTGPRVGERFWVRGELLR